MSVTVMCEVNDLENRLFEHFMMLIVIITLCFEKFPVTLVYISATRAYFCMIFLQKLLNKNIYNFVVKFLLKYIWKWQNRAIYPETASILPHSEHSLHQ